MLNLAITSIRNRVVALIVIPSLVFYASGANACQLINDFVKDVETGRSKVLFDAHVKLLDVAKPHPLQIVRRYSVRLPSSVPSEIMQLEIVDGDDAAKAWQEKTGTRHLRVRPHSVSHWINMSASAVTFDIYDHIVNCPRTKSELCGGFGIHFESKDAAIEVGFLSYTKSDQHYIDHVVLTVREQWCTEPDMFSK